MSYEGGANMFQANCTLSSYRIRVGHWETRVAARNAAEAIEVARRQLAREFPRLYDLIQALSDQRFQIERAA